MPKNNINYLNLQFFELKSLILNCINNLKGQDVICFNMGEYHITKLMVLCTGQSNRHVISLAQDILYKLKNIHFQHHEMEGSDLGEWILIDLGDIIIHIMKKETRQLYALERLWS